MSIYQWSRAAEAMLRKMLLKGGLLVSRGRKEKKLPETMCRMEECTGSAGCSP